MKNQTSRELVEQLKQILQTAKLMQKINDLMKTTPTQYRENALRKLGLQDSIIRQVFNRIKQNKQVFTEAEIVHLANVVAELRTEIRQRTAEEKMAPRDIEFENGHIIQNKNLLTIEFNHIPPIPIRNKLHEFKFRFDRYQGKSGLWQTTLENCSFRQAAKLLGISQVMPA